MSREEWRRGGSDRVRENKTTKNLIFFSLLLNSLNSSSCQPRLLKPSLTEPLTRSSVFCSESNNNKRYQKTEKSLLDDLKYTNSNTFSFFLLSSTTCLTFWVVGRSSSINFYDFLTSLCCWLYWWHRLTVSHRLQLSFPLQ